MTTAAFSEKQPHGLIVVNEDGKLIGQIQDLNFDPDTREFTEFSVMC
jgi:sporulation protein YlmC with PRC-barrel domain